MIPRETTLAIVEEELPALAATAQRRGWSVTWQEPTLTILAEGPHPSDKTPVRIQADVSNYRSVPPIWTFLASLPRDGEPQKPPPFPKGGSLPCGAGSIFHSQRLVCAPFSRLAYSQHGGPHGDWGGPTGWLQVAGGHTKAEKLADMFAVILAHLRYSPRWYE